MTIIPHPVILPDQSRQTLLTAWVTTCSQNLTKLLSEEGIKKANFFFSTILSLRPGVVKVTVNEQTLKKLNQSKQLTITSGLRPCNQSLEQELWLGVKWEQQSEPEELWVLTLNPEKLVQPWILLNSAEAEAEAEAEVEEVKTSLTVTKPRRKKKSPQLQQTVK